MVTSSKYLRYKKQDYHKHKSYKGLLICAFGHQTIGFKGDRLECILDRSTLDLNPNGESAICIGLKLLGEL